MRKNKVSQDDLIAATKEMAGDLIDADLGGHVIKKTYSTPGSWEKFGRKNNRCNQVWASMDLLV